MKEGKAQTDFPLSLKLDDDKVLVFATNSSPILDSNFNMRGAMATFNDESALQEANGVLLEMMDKLRKSQDEVNKQNSELKRLATRDPMTNCLNRRAFFERMDKAFTLAQSEKKPLGCVMVDIDHFKKDQRRAWPRSRRQGFEDGCQAAGLQVRKQYQHLSLRR